MPVPRHGIGWMPWKHPCQQANFCPAGIRNIMLDPCLGLGGGPFENRWQVFRVSILAQDLSRSCQRPISSFQSKLPNSTLKNPTCSQIVRSTSVKIEVGQIPHVLPRVMTSEITQHAKHNIATRLMTFPFRKSSAIKEIDP